MGGSLKLAQLIYSSVCADSCLNIGGQIQKKKTTSQWFNTRKDVGQLSMILGKGATECHSRSILNKRCASLRCSPSLMNLSFWFYLDFSIFHDGA